MNEGTAFRLVWLWSDILIWLLFACCVIGGVWAAHDETMRQTWRKVGQSALAMASAALLTCYLTIGLLDSIHLQFRLASHAAAQQVKGDTSAPEVHYSPEVLSVLDVIASGLRERREKTYSAPYAAHLFAKETREANGVQTREFPALRHAPQAADAASLTAVGLAKGAVAWMGLCGIFVFYRFARYAQSVRSALNALLGKPQEQALAWRSFMLTLLIVFLFAGVLCQSSGGLHVFGTDKVGQDVFYLTLKSIRTALLIGTLTTLVTLPLAILLGLVAGYRGGWWDDVIQYVYTVLNSIPGVLLIAAMVLMMQVIINMHPEWFETAAQRSDARLLALCFILGLTSWTGLCRLLRAETLKLRELEYVQAARAFGVSDLAIMWRHILPNLFHIILIALVMDFSGLVLSEAVLSYIGIGVDANTTSFGSMINAARLELSREPVVWWILVAAFVFMFMLVLAANVLADAVRDAFDPRWQGGVGRTRLKRAAKVLA